MLRLDQQSDNAGDWEAVEPSYAAPLGLIKKEYIGPDLKSKGDAFRFACVKFLFEQVHQSHVGGLDHL